MQLSVFVRFFFCLTFLAASLYTVPGTAWCAAAPLGKNELDSFNRQLLQRAEAAQAAGKHDAALNFYLKILEEYPDNESVLRSAGDILFQQNKYADAAGAYLRLLRQRPEDANVMTGLGLARQRLGQLYEAQATLFRAINTPGITAENANMVRKALAEIYNNWDVLNVMQERKDNPAQERFHSFQIDTYQNQAGVSYALRGLVRQSLDRPEEAVSDYNAALEFGGMNDELKNLVIQNKNAIERHQASKNFWQEIEKKVAELKGRPDELEPYFTSLLEHEEARGFAFVSRAFLRLDRNDFDGAESDLKDALRANPNEKARADIEDGLRQVAERRRQAEQAAQAENAAEQAGEQAAESAPGAEQTAPAQQAENLSGQPDGAAPTAPAQSDEQAHAPQPSFVAPPYENPYEYFDQIDLLIQQGKYTQAQSLLAKTRRLSLGNEEKGIAFYYQGELDAAKGNADAAYQKYQQAAALAREPYRKSSAYYRIAEYHAAQGNKDEAALYAERSASALPDADWKIVQVGHFLNGLGQPDKALVYFESALRLHPEPRSAANAAMGLADAYKTKKDMEGYAKATSLYIDTVNANAAVFADGEKGEAAFLQAESLEKQGNESDAFAYLQKASALLSDEYRLSETYIKMAEYQLKQGNGPQAAKYAHASAALLPEAVWRLQGVAGIFGQIGDTEQAARYLRQAIDLAPATNGHLYREIAGLHSQANEKEEFLQSNAAFIDYLTDKLEKDGQEQSPEDILALHDARVSQKNVSRTWGFSSYTYYSKSDQNNYFYGMTNELSYELRFPGGRTAKLYGQYVGTLTSYFSGDYMDASTQKQQEWESRTHWNDSAHGVVGIQVHPFASLYNLSFDLEYMFPLHDGPYKDDDVRVRASYGWTEGDEPKPFGNIWDYIKFHTSATYSMRDGDVTSDYSFAGGDLSAGSEFRYGKTLVLDADRNFLVIPFAQVKASHLGKTRKPGERWQVETGPGIIFKKWFNEDKYHAPRSSLELQIYYNWELVNRNENWFGINTAITF